MSMITFLSILCVLLVPSQCRLADEDISSIDKCVIDRCFHQPVEDCPSIDSRCRCQKLPKCKFAAVCCNLNKFQLTEGLNCAGIKSKDGVVVAALHIRNATLDVLDINENDSVWRRLKYMTITDGDIKNVTGDFGRYSSISCLNLSSNGITTLGNRSLVHLTNLTLLDLSRNNLSDVPRLKKEGNVTLDISGNKHMQCLNIFEALGRTELHFNNINDTYCSSAGTYHWFNETLDVPITQVLGIYELRRDCLQNCSCEPQRIDIIPHKPPTFSVAVNCSGQRLTSLPTPLPPNTVALNISDNNISSLELLTTDPSYENIREFYADNNQIASILPLEGSKFMDNFVYLSLRSNKLKTLPTYILSNMFDRNNFRRVNLGLNKLHCDCNAAKVLRVWLLRNNKNIQDYEEIYCDNMDSKVMDLNSSKLCQTQQDWTDYIYYIITAEVLLLVGLIAKVFYDYWVFKTSGYLPWPASKMPKLPCDWLCE